MEEEQAMRGWRKSRPCEGEGRVGHAGIGKEAASGEIVPLRRTEGEATMGRPHVRQGKPWQGDRVDVKGSCGKEEHHRGHALPGMEEARSSSGGGESVMGAAKRNH